MSKQENDNETSNIDGQTHYLLDLKGHIPWDDASGLAAHIDPLVKSLGEYKHISAAEHQRTSRQVEKVIAVIGYVLHTSSIHETNKASLLTEDIPPKCYAVYREIDENLPFEYIPMKLRNGSEFIVSDDADKLSYIQAFKTLFQKTFGLIGSNFLQDDLDDEYLLKMISGLYSSHVCQTLLDVAPIVMITEMILNDKEENLEQEFQIKRKKLSDETKEKTNFSCMDLVLLLNMKLQPYMRKLLCQKGGGSHVIRALLSVLAGYIPFVRQLSSMDRRSGSTDGIGNRKKGRKKNQTTKGDSIPDERFYIWPDRLKTAFDGNIKTHFVDQMLMTNSTEEVASLCYISKLLHSLTNSDKCKLNDVCNDQVYQHMTNNVILSSLGVSENNYENKSDFMHRLDISLGMESFESLESQVQTDEYNNNQTKLTNNSSFYLFETFIKLYQEDNSKVIQYFVDFFLGRSLWIKKMDFNDMEQEKLEELLIPYLKVSRLTYLSRHSRGNYVIQALLERSDFFKDDNDVLRILAKLCLLKKSKEIHQLQKCDEFRYLLLGPTKGVIVKFAKLINEFNKKKKDEDTDSEKSEKSKVESIFTNLIYSSYGLSVKESKASQSYVWPCIISGIPLAEFQTHFDAQVELAKNDNPNLTEQQYKSVIGMPRENTSFSTGLNLIKELLQFETEISIRLLLRGLNDLPKFHKIIDILARDREGSYFLEYVLKTKSFQWQLHCRPLSIKQYNQNVLKLARSMSIHSNSWWLHPVASFVLAASFQTISKNHDDRLRLIKTLVGNDKDQFHENLRKLAAGNTRIYKMMRLDMYRRNQNEWSKYWEDVNKMDDDWDGIITG